MIPCPQFSKVLAIPVVGGAWLGGVIAAVLSMRSSTVVGHLQHLAAGPLNEPGARHHFGQGTVQDLGNRASILMYHLKRWRKNPLVKPSPPFTSRRRADPVVCLDHVEVFWKVGFPAFADAGRIVGGLFFTHTADIITAVYKHTRTVGFCDKNCRYLFSSNHF